MADPELAVKCGRCQGTGIDDNAKDLQGNPVPASCAVCGGDGYVALGKLDITDLQADVTKCLHRLKKIMDNLGLND